MFDNLIMPLLPPGERHLTWELTKTWLYRCCFIGSVLLLVGFAAVLPIDSIAQASVSDNNALNTFIVVGAIVVFFVICVVVIVGRLIYRKSCLVDIPRRYLPVTEADLPHYESRQYILTNMDRSKEMGIYFKKPKGPVVHDGLEPPLRCDVLLSSSENIDAGNDNNNNNDTNSKIFPEYLNYETCMKVVSNRIKYQGFFLSIVNLEMETQDTFSDIIRKQFILGHGPKQTQVQKAQRFVQLYESLQFSGKPIKREDFIEFVELSVYFADSIATSDKSLKGNNRNYKDTDILTRINTKSNQSLRYRTKRNPKWDAFTFGDKHTTTATPVTPPPAEEDKTSPFAEDNNNTTGDNDVSKYPTEASSFQNKSMNRKSGNESSGNDTDFAADTISYFPSVSSPFTQRRHNSIGSVAKSGQISSLSGYTNTPTNCHSLNELSKPSELSNSNSLDNLTNANADMSNTESLNSVVRHT